MTVDGQKSSNYDENKRKDFEISPLQRHYEQEVRRCKTDKLEGSTMCAARRMYSLRTSELLAAQAEAGFETRGGNIASMLSRRITIDMLLTWVSLALSKIGAGYIPVVQ